MAKLPCNANPEDASAEGAAIISAQAPYAIASASPFFRLFPLLAFICQSIQRHGSQNDAVNSGRMDSPDRVLLRQLLNRLLR